MEPMTLRLRIENGTENIGFTEGIPSHEELDALLRYLGNYRASIEPEVPSDLPDGLAPEFPIEDESGTEVMHALDGSSVLALRHPGFGWLGFRLSATDRSWLIEALLADEQRQEDFGPAH